MPQENRSEDAPALPPLVKMVAFLGMSEVEFAVLGALEFAGAELGVDLLCDAGDEDSFDSSFKKQQKFIDLHYIKKYVTEGKMHHVKHVCEDAFKQGESQSLK